MQIIELPTIKNAFCGSKDVSTIGFRDIVLSESEINSLKNFRTERYFFINELRWRLLLQTNINFEGKVIFEPGAGVGDQTQWLLKRGAAHIYVSDGRDVNVGLIRKRFNGDPRVTVLRGNLEWSLSESPFQLQADVIFLWGVYYHIYDPAPEFPVLKQLSQIAPLIVLDYLESATGADYVEHYGYDNVSASISYSSLRPTESTMQSALHKIFGNVYLPVDQMDWHDPAAPNTPRRIIIGSRDELRLKGVVRAL